MATILGSTQLTTKYYSQVLPQNNDPQENLGLEDGIEELAQDRESELHKAFQARESACMRSVRTFQPTRQDRRKTIWGKFHLLDLIFW